ncbi:N66 matrix protein-like isoform X3 [Mytilus californianus]|uniref:N66 matrix protein-like isoform X3 n=1 Tax=Mytilus californianus TaxID=6549 RepID=UPI002247E906|nr:N66 matrix protein-like isoform X3 [Mytilus californianus]
MDSSCVICKGNDNQQTQFQYDDGQHFVTHGLTKPKINRKTQVANVTGKKSTFCTDKQADFSEDVGDMNSLQRFKNPYISNSENFRGDRGQTRRGRGKGMEKAMQVVTTNEKTRKPNKPDKVHIPPSLKLHVEKGPKRDRKDKHNAQEGKKRFQNKTSARGRPNKRDGRDDNNGSSGRVHDQEDYIYYNGRSDGRSGEFNTDGYRDNNHNRGYQGFRGRGRGRGGNRGRGHEDNKYENESPDGRSLDFNRGQGRGNNRGRGRGRGHEDNKYGNESRGGRSREINRGQGRGGNSGRDRGRGRVHEDNNNGDEIPDRRSREFSRDRHQDDSNDRGIQEYRGRGRGRGGNRGRGRGRRGR